MTDSRSLHLLEFFYEKMMSLHLMLSPAMKGMQLLMVERNQEDDSMPIKP